MRALHVEVGNLNDGFGPLRLHSLATDDLLADVLDPAYFAVQGATGWAPGDLILAMTDRAAEAGPCVSLLLVTDVHPPARAGRGAPQRVRVQVLQTWGATAC
jgi:hypothetical protein